MNGADRAAWLGLGAVILFVLSRRSAGGVDAMPWTFAGLGFDPNYIPPPPQRTIAIANRTIQPAYQGGTRAPGVVDTQVDQSAAGNVYAGVPFMY